MSKPVTKDEQLGAALNEAARDLPDGWKIEITVERGAGWARLHNPDGARADDFEDGDLDLPESIQRGIEIAKGNRP